MFNADVLLEKAPPRRRALQEVAFVFLAVFAPSVVGGLGRWAVVAVGVALLGAGLFLLRPRKEDWAAILALIVALVGACAGVWELAGAEKPEGLSLSMTPLSIRALGMCLLVAVLLWRDGQGPAQVGVVREGWPRELLVSLAVIAGTYVVHIGVAVPLGLLAMALKLTGAELMARKDVAKALLETNLSVPAFAAIMLVVTGFEEFVFRAFLVPRLRVVLGRWVPAVLAGGVLFAVGHFYEGVIAVFQTFALGVWFGFVLLYRGRLLPLIIAHATFNTVSYALMLLLARSGFLDKLPTP
ncbi:CPBP family intramembrane glutamic endopeptidase [Pyxidicoccus fallax]|uniref:CPBP family intramembrane glutamic endopeptidase n=1 Tax=Pyxidicoccus fallax TaxID=394095 RepID=UPI0031B64596